ncbi:6-carboxytetrahydropterin synthase [Bacillus sonorensis]|uniref:6-carboxy-5,6,7,8-tetrahydropterin synthase n=2 Tax=Bacillus sonorensis TaxID=119858 RepID=M5P8K2_9BACI|nr:MULTISPECIES: 6-carboxytetrahydropterin synthase [Bacillus]TWK82385.1 6-carboxy-5,6,7,8-tetrahydropterin synthase [Bacillus paralicheniformis]ASB88874.1 6-pyruvoyltetrahydropterin synthase [Bacillus sonorensis]EME76321.1 6-pyruvoyl tetrahydrobiopterin synthase [Bacillus sonorensis L12]MBG9915339.1 6-pyruvoyl tetrahydrobiopterin synthase [Bacillus sonorensis]MCY8024504.1 6-carboxytetrahydropterin synthase [Bacillus sonorensis]
MSDQYVYTLTKHFWISCAHKVAGAGKCERLHGHNYKVTFCITGSALDEKDMLIDFREVKHHLEKKYDHYVLNDFDEFNKEKGGYEPSTERVAQVFFEIIESLCKTKRNKPNVKWVDVLETNEASARYEKFERR